MSLAKAYTMSYGQLPEFFSKIKEGQAPERFSQQLLKDLGFTSTNHRAYIPILKELGFLSAEGTPTSRYLDYRDDSKSKKVLGEAIREAYSDLFLIKEHPTESDKTTIQGKFKSYHNVSQTVAKHMTSTFYALLGLADLSASGRKKAKKEPETPEGGQSNESSSEGDEKCSQSMNPAGLHYNIQIHLPATKDIEVYNAIFKSVKEHLFAT